jgi:hypothetical protein
VPENQTAEMHFSGTFQNMVDAMTHDRNNDEPDKGYLKDKVDQAQEHLDQFKAAVLKPNVEQVARDSGVAQLEEQQSPKLSVEGSTPSAPAQEAPIAQGGKVLVSLPSGSSEPVTAETPPAGVNWELILGGVIIVGGALFALLRYLK